MEPTQDNYPLFEANQVLSYSHLNQLFDYLDEQERLTRANLVGIGIVCGLEIGLDPNGSPAAIHLSRGCGVTSQGYLIVEQEDVQLVSYRSYTLPVEPRYPQFLDQSEQQYPLWELFPAGEPESTPLLTPAGFLDDKALLLFLELDREGLRNCCANSCDDRGSAVTVGLRRLLIARGDLDKIIARGEGAGAGLGGAPAAGPGLEEIRLPRYEVPNGNPATSAQLLAAFQKVFQGDKLARKTSELLSAAYQAFRPLLADLYPDDPFAGTFLPKFGFLDQTPESPEQVRFLQYYYDFFDDLFRALDELRSRGGGLLCACAPPQGLFPRHLMLGLLPPQASGGYRHRFLAAPPLGHCDSQGGELRQLFRRMVGMILGFSNEPPLGEGEGEGEIRVTPGRLGELPLSEKPIPYYYAPDQTPPLYTVWSPEKSRRNGANLNLGYHSDRYHPPAPPFVTEPLKYDLEPFNFLRVEGHLGKNYLLVLRTLLDLKRRYRLPIEIVALRTGTFDEGFPVDLSRESCRFQELEALYGTLRGELSCFLCKEVQYLYNLPEEGGGEGGAAAPKLPMLLACAPGFQVQPGTLGRLFEEWFQSLGGRRLAEVDLGINLRFASRFNVLLFLIAYLARLYDQLAGELREVDFAELEKRYQELLQLAQAIEGQREQNTGSIDGNAELLKWEELDDRLEAIVFNCRLEPLKELRDEYLRRIREVKQKGFLSFFLQQHPGVQHKAGVPLGGTFILVYHERAAATGTGNLAGGAGNLAGNLGDAILRRSPLSGNRTLARALDRVGRKEALLADPDIRAILGELTGRIPFPPPFPGGLEEGGDIFAQTVEGLQDGAVIADLFLPYLCCSDCAPIQYLLPVPPLGLSVQLACTDAETGSAEATVTPEGGTPPYSYQLDARPFAELSGKLPLPAGPHTLQLRDAAGAESGVQSLTVPAALVIGEPSFIDDASANSYRVSCTVSGGVAPYQTESGSVADGTFTSKPVPSGQPIAVTIADQAGCQASREFRHTVCQLPCGGQSRRCAYRLWLQPPSEGAVYESYQQGEIRLRFNGDSMAIPVEVLQLDAGQLNGGFDDAIAAAVKRLNEAVEHALTERLGGAGKNRLLLSYQPREAEPFRTLLIEYFVCDTFAVEFDYLYAQPNPAFALTMRYGNEQIPTGASFDGAFLLNRRLSKLTLVPAFDCSERNQCDGGEYRRLCDGFDPHPFFSVEQPAGSNLFVFSGSVADSSRGISAWVWDLVGVQAPEPFYEGARQEVPLQAASGRARLTVITDKGCFSAVTQRFPQP